MFKFRFGWLKRVQDNWFAQKDQKELAELDLDISPTETPGILLINGTRARVVPSGALSIGEKPPTADME